MMTPEKEVRAQILGRVLYEELIKKGYSDAELKTAGALLHDLARDHERSGTPPRRYVTDEELAPTMKVVEGMRKKDRSEFTERSP